MSILKLNPVMVAGIAAASMAASQAMAWGGSSCEPLFEKGVMEIGFNPTQINIDKLNGKDALLIPSFFNAFKNPVTRVWEGGFLDRDKIGVVENIRKEYRNFDEATDLEVITDIELGRFSVEFGTLDWPNGADVAPAGMFPFQAIVSAQGFHSSRNGPGRVSVIDYDDPLKTEYVVHQSTIQGPFGSGPTDPNNSPRYYHDTKYFDMDNDGDLDIVTNRSGFKVGGGPPRTPYGELVWFENPGEDLDPNVQWNETVIWGGIPGVDNFGPDIHLDMGDLDGDGYPEIVATNFWVGDGISVFGAPEGGTWADVDWTNGQYPQQAVISNDQGKPFDVEIGDLNLDGIPDVLASNHQPDQCHPQTSSEVPGRVYALQPPADGNIYQTWIVHVLKDNIKPQPSTIPIGGGFGRLAPGPAHQYNVIKFLEGIVKPRILVGGDEAGKAWVLTPKKPFDPNNWEYNSKVIFDINDYYGEFTTQTFIEEPPQTAITISTQGSPTIGYHRDGPFGLAELYLPVFEGQDIHILSYKWGWGRSLISCGDDDLYECPVLPE